MEQVALMSLGVNLVKVKMSEELVYCVVWTDEDFSEERRHSSKPRAG